MPHLLVELDVVRQLHDSTINAGSHETLFQEVIEEIAVLALPLAPDHAIGDIVHVRVTEAMPRSVTAELVMARPHGGQIAMVAL